MLDLLTKVPEHSGEELLVHTEDWVSSEKARLSDEFLRDASYSYIDCEFNANELVTLYRRRQLSVCVHGLVKTVTTVS